MTFWKVVLAVIVGNAITGLLGVAAWAIFTYSAVSEFDRQVNRELEQGRQRIERMYAPRLQDHTAPLSPWADEPSAQSRSRQQTSREQHARLVAETRKLCDFWGEEVRRDPSDFNRAHREAACNRHREAINSR